MIEKRSSATIIEENPDAMFSCDIEPDYHNDKEVYYLDLDKGPCFVSMCLTESDLRRIVSTIERALDV